MKIGIVLGTRPQIIKMSPLIKELAARAVDYFVIDTGQHTIPAMQSEIYSDLDLPVSKYMLGEYDYSKTADRVRQILMDENPDIVQVHGDTDSCVIGAMAAACLGIPVAHHEAGLRANTLWMKEEQNRVIVDHMAQFLYAPTGEAMDRLEGEGCRGLATQTGNMIADVLRVYRRDDLETCRGDYALLTLHRAENVDDEKTLASILAGVTAIPDVLGLRVIWPMHPRAKDKIDKFGLPLRDIEVIPPAGFHKFLDLEQSAKLILTDSGGVQEEACILGAPCITLRGSTERPETLYIGANKLAGSNPHKILKCAEAMLNRNLIEWEHPYGDGHTAERIFNSWVGSGQ